MFLRASPKTIVSLTFIKYKKLGGSCYRQKYAYYFILTSPCKPELVKETVNQIISKKYGSQGYWASPYQWRWASPNMDGPRPIWMGLAQHRLIKGKGLSKVMESIYAESNEDRSSPE